MRQLKKVCEASMRLRGGESRACLVYLPERAIRANFTRAGTVL
jgi:hypothetical protein